MKKIISILVSVSILMTSLMITGTVGAFVASGKCGDNIIWEYENGVLSLKGTGDTYDYSWDDDYRKNPPPWFELRGNITDIKISEGITGLGRLALVGCVNMKTIILPSTLERIGERVFMDWINLEEIKLPKNVKSIGEGAFEWSDAFSKITIYEGVTEFGDGVFEACANLKIYGKKGSKAEEYAAANNIPFISLDDASAIEKYNKIVLKINDTAASVFGNTVTNDVAPIIRNDRTMLPARFVAENLGARVDWYGPGQTVIISRGDTTIIITIGSLVASVNGAPVSLDSPAFIENGRTYTPVRFIVENLGAKVEWNGATKEVTIIK